MLRVAAALLAAIVGLVALGLLLLTGYGMAIEHIAGLALPFLLCCAILIAVYGAGEWALRPWIRWNVSDRTFRWIVAMTAAASVLICATLYLTSTQRLREQQELVTIHRAELQRLGSIDREVVAFQASKARLQQQIDLINQLKQNQLLVSPAVTAVANLGDDAALIDSVSIDASAIVMSGRAQSAQAIDRLSRKLGAESHIARDGSFTLRVKR
jgi:Tfp pilus assembly protein PilN